VVNNVKVPVNPNASEPYGVKPPSRDFSSHSIDRNKRHTEPSHHALLDRFCMVELHCHSELYTRPLQRPFGDAAGRRSFFAHQQRLISERIGPNIPTPGPCVRRGDNENEFVAHPGPQAFFAGPEGVPTDDPEIELPFSYSSLNRLRIGDLEFDLYAGVLRSKRRDDSWQHVQPGGGAGTDQERPVSQAIQVGKRLACALDS